MSTYRPIDPEDRPTRAEAEYDEFVCKSPKPHPQSAAEIAAYYAEVYGEADPDEELPF